MDNMEKSYSRREFIATAGAAGAGALFSTTVANAGTASAQGGSSYTGVRTRAFGKTGVKVSMLGLGGYFDTAMNVSLLSRPQNLGLTSGKQPTSLGARDTVFILKVIRDPGKRFSSCQKPSQRTLKPWSGTWIKPLRTSAHPILISLSSMPWTGSRAWMTGYGRLPSA